MSIKDVIALLTAVGFSSPPSWLRPFCCLSTGEQFRVSMARLLAELSGMVVVDEFTSVVDRQVAQVASHALQREVRRQNRRFIALSCHYDILEWLQPDWVYQPHSNQFQWRSLQRHPALECQIYPIDKTAWTIFRKHHYLNTALHPSAKCFGGFISEEIVAFTSYLFFAHPRAKNIMMGHRLVVLPDWQGLGIGGRLDDWLGQYLFDRGYRYHNCVAHPAMIAYYLKSPRWRSLGRSNSGIHLREPAKKEFVALRKRTLQVRSLMTYSFEYVPPAGTEHPFRS